VNIYYHYGKGKIVANSKQYLRSDLVGKARNEESLNDKESVEDAKS